MFKHEAKRMLNKTRKELDKRFWPLYDLGRSKYLLSPDSKKSFNVGICSDGTLLYWQTSQETGI